MDKNALYDWTPELSYAIGLITTDGSLSKDRRHIELTSVDLQQIRNFKKCLSLKNKICTKSSSYNTGGKHYRLQFGDVKLYRWLLYIGLIPNKTHHLGRLSVPEIYFRDFLRGHLDGDGSIVTYTDRYMSYKGKRYKYNRLYLTFYSSSLQHIKWLQSTITRLLQVEGSLAGWKNKYRNIVLWKLRFAKKDSLKLLSWIYYKPNLLCLNRKRKIAERFLN